jgi:hypothetical protein
MESKKINQLATELTPVLSDLTIIGDPTTGISKKITLSQMASLFTGTVEEYPNLASFPLVGTADTIYIALDTNVLYRWNTGTNAYVELSPNIINSLVFNDANGFDGTISLVGSVATLTITTALTTGSVGFIGASGALLQDNANFFWDDSNNRLGIGTNAPTTAIDAFGSGIITRVNGTSTNNAFVGFASAGSNKWSIGNVQSDHRFRIYNDATTSELVSVLQTGEFGIGIANPTTKFHIDGGASALIANLDANVSVAKSVSFRSDNSNRINLEVSGTESGSNAGANFFLRTYTDLGALIETPFQIIRSTGVTTIKSLTLTNALDATSGGTGQSSYSIGDLLYASTTTALSKLADVATGNALISGGVGVAPSWGKIGLTTHVSGTLPIANGGTGSATQNFVDLTTTQSIGGAKTFTSALSGTSATFSGNFTFTAGFNQSIGWGGNTSAAAANPLIYSNDNYLALNSKAGSPLYLNFDNTNAASTINMFNGKFILTQGGAATFTSSTAGYGITLNHTTENLRLKMGAIAGGIINIQGEVISSAGAYPIVLNYLGGNVGIATDSPQSLLDVKGTASVSTVSGRSYNTGIVASQNPNLVNGSGFLSIPIKVGDVITFFGGQVRTVTAVTDTQLTLNANWTISFAGVNATGFGGIGFNVSNSQAAIINAGGALLVGTTTTTGIATGTSVNQGVSIIGGIASQVNNNSNQYWSKATGYTSGDFTAHFVNGGYVGGISTNGSTTNYAVASDYRLKQDLKDFIGIELIDKIKIYDYQWKVDESRMYGVIAHELAEILPYAVSGEKDTERMQGVDYSKIVPVLVKAIQELKYEIEILKNK